MKRHERFASVLRFHKPRGKRIQSDRVRTPRHKDLLRHIGSRAGIPYVVQCGDIPEGDRKQQIIRLIELLLGTIPANVAALVRLHGKNAVAHKPRSGIPDAEVAVRVHMRHMKRSQQPPLRHAPLPKLQRTVMRRKDRAGRRMRRGKPALHFEKRPHRLHRPRRMPRQCGTLADRRKRTAVLQKEIKIQVKDAHRPFHTVRYASGSRIDAASFQSAPPFSTM